ncbi:MAG: thiolase family protein [Chloroflexi bacterium]|nr:thiolase family protein [Chloroflexota bacterium]
MSDSRGRVAVVGVGHSKVYRRADVPLGTLTVDACRLAIEDAGLSAADIDGVVSPNYQPFEMGEPNRDGINLVTPGFIVEALGLEVNWGESVSAGSTGHCLIEAINAVAGGTCNYALVFRALYSPAGRRYGFVAPTTAEGPGEFRGSYGLFAPGMYALFMQKYMDKYGATREQMAAFASNNRQNALKWEHGYWYQHGGGPLTIEDYMTSRMISYPMCIFDCDIPVQGCGAFVVTTAERAKDLRQPPAYVLSTSAPVNARMGIAHSLEEFAEAGARLGSTLLSNAGIGPGDVDVANLYDGFSILTPLWAEALGFCGEGEGFSFITAPTLALNTSSGNLGAGRMHGVPQIMDSVLQVTGRSGPRQVENAHIALAVVLPLDAGKGLVFSKSPS